MCICGNDMGGEVSSIKVGLATALMISPPRYNRKAGCHSTRSKHPVVAGKHVVTRNSAVVVEFDRFTVKLPASKRGSGRRDRLDAHKTCLWRHAWFGRVCGQADKHQLNWIFELVCAAEYLSLSSCSERITACRCTQPVEP